MCLRKKYNGRVSFSYILHQGATSRKPFTGLSWEDDYVVLVQVPLKNIYRRTIHHLWLDHHVNNDQQRPFILWCQQVLSIIWWLVLSATFFKDICQLTSFIMGGSCQQQAATFIALEPILSTNTAWLPGNNERLLQVDHISDKQQLLYFSTINLCALLWWLSLWATRLKASFQHTSSMDGSCQLQQVSIFFDATNVYVSLEAVHHQVTFHSSCKTMVKHSTFIYGVCTTLNNAIL